MVRGLDGIAVTASDGGGGGGGVWVLSEFAGSLWTLYGGYGTGAQVQSMNGRKNSRNFIFAFIIRIGSSWGDMDCVGRRYMVLHRGECLGQNGHWLPVVCR